jgi:anti-sigma B factor antagonist
LNAATASEFRTKIINFVEDGNVNIVINLSEVDLIDSMGLGTLVSLLKKVSGRGEIRLCNLKENVKSLFHLTRLDKVFTLYRSEEEAIRSFIG